jgi:hypothetical protein
MINVWWFDQQKLCYYFSFVKLYFVGTSISCIISLIQVISIVSMMLKLFCEKRYFLLQIFIHIAASTLFS